MTAAGRYAGGHRLYLRRCMWAAAAGVSVCMSLLGAWCGTRGDVWGLESRRSEVPAFESEASVTGAKESAPYLPCSA